MGQDLKISELAVKAINSSGSGTTVDVSELIQNNKFIVPAYINGEGNKSLDIGLMFLIFKSYIDLAAGQAVLNQIDQGNIGGGGSSGGGSGGSSGGGSSVDLTQLTNRVNALLEAVYNPSNYPVTYIKLTDGTSSSVYQIVTGLGQSSPYTEGSPIIIRTTSVTTNKFYATISPSSPSVSGTTAYIPFTLNIYSERNGVVYQGGTIGNINVTVGLTTSSGHYDSLGTYNDLSSTVLNSSNSSASLSKTMEVTVSAGTTISIVTVTCSIGGKALGNSGVYANNTSISGTGTI